MIAYDTNVLIYALESESQYSKFAREVVKKAEAEGAVLSVLVKHEILTGLVIMHKDIEIAKNALGSLVGAKWHDVNEKIVLRAVDMTKKYGNKLKGYDAIIVATAVVGGAIAFYTNDKLLVDLNITEIEIKPLLANA